MDSMGLTVWCAECGRERMPSVLACVCGSSTTRSFITVPYSTLALVTSNGTPYTTAHMGNDLNPAAA